MSVWENSTLTNKGVNLQSKILEGRCMFNLTKCVTGSGNVSAVILRDQTALSSPKQTATLQVFNRKENEITIPVLITNIGLSTGYDLWQIGFYATDPDEGEILYAIAQASHAKYIPSENESKGYTLLVNFVFSLSTDGDVEIAFDPAGLVTFDSLNMVKDELMDEIDKLSHAQAGYAPKDHNHNETYAPKDHGHDEKYSPKDHNHDNTYSPKDHNHDENYAPKNHNHDETYSPKDHGHDEKYSPKDHNHDETYSPKAHSHNIETDEITGTLPISKGGTGSTSAAEAIANLGLKTETLNITYDDGSTGTLEVYVK